MIVRNNGKPKDRPEPDDGPEPQWMTPCRLGAHLHQITVELAGLGLRTRSKRPYLRAESDTVASQRLDQAWEHIEAAGLLLVDLAADVRVGRVEIVHDVSGTKHSVDRPLLDVIEARPLVRRIEAVAETVVARGDTEPAWEDGPGYHAKLEADWDLLPDAEQARLRSIVLKHNPGFAERPELLFAACLGALEESQTRGPAPPPEYPPAAAARAAAKRRKGKATSNGTVDPLGCQVARVHSIEEFNATMAGISAIANGTSDLARAFTAVDDSTPVPVRSRKAQARLAGKAVARG